MIDQKTADIIALLAADGLEAGGNASDAAILLVDAALALLAGNLGLDRARGRVDVLAAYVAQQGHAMLDGLERDGSR